MKSFKVGRLIINLEVLFLGKVANQMKENEFHQNGGWKLHDCPDGSECDCMGGGCASGWCSRLSVRPDEEDTPRYITKTIL